MSSLAPSALLELLLEREGRGQLGECAFTPYDLSLWAYTRSSLVVQLTDALSGTDWVPRFWEDRSTLRDKATFAFRALRGHPLRVADRPFSIVFFCSGVGNYLRRGVYVNRLSDHFAQCFPDDTFLVEDSDARAFARPRGFPHLGYHDAILVRAVIEAKVRRVSAADRRAIDDFVGKLRELFGQWLDAASFEALRRHLLGVARQAPSWRRDYVELFDRLRPRVILVEDACYGHRSHLIRWARERGITTAEYQHGLVGANHYAYHYHPSITASRYAGDLPDYFLAYGRYWVQDLGVPSRAVVIGNPHLSEAVRTIARRSDHRTVLFVSGAQGVALYCRVLAEIATVLPPSVRLVFRPHPSERGHLAGYQETFARHGISIDEQRMAYQSVVDADLVIGDVSTLLFEAAAFGRPVIVLESDESRRNIPGDLFPFVSDLSTVPHHLEAGPRADTHADELWDPSWHDNYRAFVREVVGA